MTTADTKQHSEYISEAEAKSRWYVTQDTITYCIAHPWEWVTLVQGSRLRHLNTWQGMELRHVS